VSFGRSPDHRYEVGALEAVDRIVVSIDSEIAVRVVGHVNMDCQFEFAATGRSHHEMLDRVEPVGAVRVAADLFEHQPAVVRIPRRTGAGKPTEVDVEFCVVVVTDNMLVPADRHGIVTAGIDECGRERYIILVHLQRTDGVLTGGG